MGEKQEFQLSDERMIGMSKADVREFYEDLLRPEGDVKKQYRKRIFEKIWSDDYLLSYREAARLYGFTYQTIRVYVSLGFLQTVQGQQSRITHAEMRRYISGKKGSGAPTKAFREG